MQFDALTHPFFDELRDPNTRLPNGRFLPPLFNFKSHGMLILEDRLSCPWLWSFFVFINNFLADFLYVIGACTRTERSPIWDFGEIGSRACKEAMPVSWLVKCNRTASVVSIWECRAFLLFKMIFVGIFIVFGCPVKSDLEIHATHYHPTPRWVCSRIPCFLYHSRL